MRVVAIACLVACVRGQGATDAYVGTNAGGDVTINGPRVLTNGVDQAATLVGIQGQVTPPSPAPLTQCALIQSCAPDATTTIRYSPLPPPIHH